MITYARDAAAVIRRLATSLADTKIRHVIITSYMRDRYSLVAENGMFISVVLDGIFTYFSIDPELIIARSEEARDIFLKVWYEVFPESVVAYEPYISGALHLAKQLGESDGGMQTLITGSQHLVGPALSLLQES